MSTNLGGQRTPLDPLRDKLAGVTAGQIDDVGVIEKLLADCWDNLQGADEGGMAA
ncbi:MAG TPA: hypothetical protein VGP68_15850 [Gemmataceae bacterium]|jgi:hypothetical protein|nr:hypothetical protein [Gemmataceae bacterium]